jgi:hypothetical protein
MRSATGSWTNRIPVPSRYGEEPRAMPRGSLRTTLVIDQLAPPVEAVVEANVDHMDLLVEAEIPRNGRALT